MNVKQNTNTTVIIQCGGRGNRGNEFLKLKWKIRELGKFGIAVLLKSISIIIW
jgi:hypothetical protein